MKILWKVQAWIADMRFRSIIHQIAIYHYHAGAISPYAVAAHEMFLRHKLEGFREFASKRYMDDRSLTLDDIKQQWLDLVVKPMAKSEFTRDDAKALKAAIVAIPHRETFIGEAKKARDADVRAAVSTARCGNVYSGRNPC